MVSVSHSFKTTTDHQCEDFTMAMICSDIRRRVSSSLDTTQTLCLAKQDKNNVRNVEVCVYYILGWKGLSVVEA